MLTIFRRHLKACPQTSRRYRRCQCPSWIEGTLGLEDVPRRSLNLTSWDTAEEYVRESTGKVGGTTMKPMLIADAVELYLTDVSARLRSSTVRLHRVLLRDSLLVWCADKGYRYLSELDVKELIEYRSSWQFAPLTALKKFERLRSFFRFCHTAKWMRENPTLAIKAPKADTPPTLPFTNEEVERTLAAAKTFRISGSYGRTNPTRVLAYIYLLRYSGLRISDATSLRKDRVTADGRLFLHMQHKTRVPVYVPLPPECEIEILLLRLRRRRNSNPSAHPERHGKRSLRVADMSLRTFYLPPENIRSPEKRKKMIISATMICENR